MTTTLYQAGAGSGKTYTITREIIARLADGTADPGRILATTFTRKAAAELRDRIQTRLLRPEDDDPVMSAERRLQLASAMGEATIGTVHSVGHQLLSRYSMQLGMSPNLEPIEDKAQERHLRNIIAEMPREGWELLERLAWRMGIENPHAVVLDQLLSHKRSNAIEDGDFRESMLAGTENLIQVISGGNSVELPDFDGFYEVCREALQRAESNGDETVGSKKCRDILADLLRASKHHWQPWGKVATLKWTKATETTVAEMTSLARRANVHAGLHADMRAITVALVDQTLALQSHYESYKQSHGLVDFTDLEERFLHLVQDESIRNDLADGLDLVVVDEFQDTNPIQLAIFQELANLAPECLWVGDDKQAIYGFRGTDPQLMRDVISNIPADRRATLDSNWRSQEGLVKAVNAIFTPIFGEDTPLIAKHHGPSRIERWMMKGSRREDRQAGFVAEVAALADEGSPGDIAILVRKNADAISLAAGLAAHGVPALVQIPGLLSTREGVMLQAALRIVADKRDKLAAVTLLHIDDNAETPAWFQQVVASPEAPIEGHLISALAEIDAKILSPSGVIARSIQALTLPDRIADWGDPMRRAANLDELIRLGQRYEDEMDQEGKAATLTGLVYWLEEIQNSNEDFLPTPAGVDAVQIMTLWKAKGLEWKAVIIYQDGKAPTPHPFKVHVHGGNAAAGKPLENRSMQYWPFPFGEGPFGGLNADGSGIKDAASESAEGQVMEQAHYDEIKRLMYVGFTRAKDTLILAEGGRGNSLELLETLNEVLDPEGRDPGLGCTYTVKETSMPAEPTAPVGASQVWFAPARGKHEFPARYWSPSKADSIDATATTEALPGTHPFPAAIRPGDWTVLGMAVHAYMAALPALADCDDELKVQHADACMARWGCSGDIEATALVAAGKRLELWVVENFPGFTWGVEVPISYPRGEGGQWTGFIDLCLQSSDESVVIDHKSADFGADGWAAKSLEYSGQLSVYAGAVGANGRMILHFPTGGGVAEVSVAIDVTSKSQMEA